MAVGDGFHVDSSGNLWLGSTRETFDATTRSEAPFYIYANGSIVANNGTFSGDISGASGTFTGDLSGADITGGTINIGSGTFQVDSSGNMTATSATLSGYLAAGSDFDDLSESGSIVGWVLDSSNGRFIGEDGSGNYLYLDSSGNIAGNYSAGSSGWIINANGDAEFNSVDIRIKASGASEGDVPSDGTQSIQIGSAQIYESNNNLYLNSNSSGNKIIISAGDKFVLSGSSANPNLTFDGASTQDIEFNAAYVADSSTSDGRSYSSEALGQVYELTISNQNVDIYRVNAQNNDVYFYGDVEVDGHIEVNSLKVYDGFGSSGEVLTRTSNGLEWAAAGGAHADSDHTSFLTESAGDSRYVNESDHTHSNLVGDTAFNNHTGSATAHGTFDNYSYWTIRGNPGGNLQTSNVGSTGTASIYAGTSMSASMSGSSITLNNTGVTSIGQSGNDGFVTAVSGSTVTTSRDLSTATIETGHHFANFYGATLGSSSFGDKWFKLYAHTSSDTSSDERLKENIININYGLDFINDLRPVEFQWKDITEYHCEDHPEEKYSKSRDYCSSCKKENDIIYMDYLKEKELFDNDLIEEEPVEPTFTPCVMIESTRDINNGKKTWGLIAQEVETVLGDYQNNVVSHDTDDDTYGLAYEAIISPLIKAVQELSAKNDALESRIAALEG